MLTINHDSRNENISLRAEIRSNTRETRTNHCIPVHIISVPCIYVKCMYPSATKQYNIQTYCTTALCMNSCYIKKKQSTYTSTKKKRNLKTSVFTSRIYRLFPLSRPSLSPCLLMPFARHRESQRLSNLLEQLYRLPLARREDFARGLKDSP